MGIALVILFCAVSALHLASLLFKKLRKAMAISKALLMPLLLACYIEAAQELSVFVILALVFACIGDCFLLYPDKPLFRGLGMGAFFITQLCYIATFVGLIGSPGRTVILLALLCYGSLFGLACFTLFQYVPKEWRLAAGIYMLSIASMSAMALLTFFTRFSNWMGMVLLGSGLFICSDFILCMEYFKEKTPYGRFIVMFTYILAQAFIVFGLAHTGGLFY
ncbi:MAG: lysoplasmalogenase [Clostridia bacterium]|nr:lysoplasmalogenase [Clostridia bacterium]